MATKRAAKSSTPKSSAVMDEMENLQFPDHVRLKPSLYIGPLDEFGVFSIVRELLDNTVDVALAGHNSRAHLHVDKKNATYWVADAGPGIPVGPMTVTNPIDGSKHRVSKFRAAVGILNSSGKYNDKDYKTSRGSHGIGQKATNALSTVFQAWTHRDGKWYTTKYERGLEKVSVSECKAPRNPFTKKPMTRGTLVMAKPDKSILGADTFPLKMFSEWAEISSYFTPEFRIVLTVEGSEKTKTWYVPEGPTAYVTSQLTKLKADPLGDSTFIAKSAFLDCVVSFTNATGEHFTAYTNGLHNVQGGVHSDAFYRSLRQSLDKFKKNDNFTVNDLKEGVVGLINAKISHPMFSSQDKVKLVDTRADKPFEEFLSAELSKFFAANKALAAAVIQQAVDYGSLKEKFRLNATAARKVNKLVRQGFSSSAVIVHNCPAEKRELYVVEGESAAGTAKNARDSRYQELLPLRGKILNSGKSSDERVMNSSAVIDILAQIGYNPNAKGDADPLAKLRVGKIILMADADSDGPLPGNTEVEIKWAPPPVDPHDAEVQVLTLRELAGPEWMSRQYLVRSWNGVEFIWTYATNCRVMEVDSTEVRIKFDTKLVQSCSPNHQWCLYTQKRLDRAAEFLNCGLQTIRADKLKAGDRIAFAQANASNNRLALEPLEIKSVKIRRTQEMSSYYCLTVPSFHNFVLRNGLVSRNCHITSLLLTLLAKYAPSLFDRGIVHLALTKQYYALHKGKFFAGDSPKEVQEKMAAVNVTTEVRHIKGLGEVDASVLRLMALDPKTRSLAKVMPWNSKSEKQEFFLLMGQNVETRKKLIGLI